MCNLNVEWDSSSLLEDWEITDEAIEYYMRYCEAALSRRRFTEAEVDYFVAWRQAVFKRGVKRELFNRINKCAWKVIT